MWLEFMCGLIMVYRGWVGGAGGLKFWWTPHIPTPGVGGWGTMTHVVRSMCKVFHMNLSNLNTTNSQPMLCTECLRGHRDPPPSGSEVGLKCLWINRGDRLFTKSESWLLILSVSIIDPPLRINRGDHLSMQRWKLTVSPLCVHCRSAPPPIINRGDHLKHRWLP